MKEQYLAQVQFQWQTEDGKDEWWNARFVEGTMKQGRYFDNLESAQRCIRNVIKSNKQMSVVQHSGLISVELTDRDIKRTSIVNTRIRKRLVSEWEEI